MNKFNSLPYETLNELSRTVTYLERWAAESLDEIKISFKKPNIKDIIRAGRESTAFFHSFQTPLDLHLLRNYISTDLYNTLLHWRSEYITSFADFMDYYTCLVLLSRELKPLRIELEDFI